MKAWRRIATRDDSCARTVPSAVALAATVIFRLWTSMRCRNGVCVAIRRYRCETGGKPAPFPYRIQWEDGGMKLPVGLDVSLEKTSTCAIGAHGKIAQEAQEAQVAGAPGAPLRRIGGADGAIAAIGLAAGPLSQGPHRGLSEAGQVSCRWKPGK